MKYLTLQLREEFGTKEFGTIVLVIIKAYTVPMAGCWVIKLLPSAGWLGVALLRSTAAKGQHGCDPGGNQSWRQRTHSCRAYIVPCALVWAPDSESS